MSKCLDDCIPLVKLFMTVCPAILYWVGFSSKPWVDDPGYELEWGLYNYCNVSDESHPECSMIWPGDSPDYYEAVRTFAAFTTVCHIFSFLTWDPNKGLGAGKIPAQLAVVTATFTLITVSVLGAKYGGDERMSGQQEFGWCFYLACVSGGINLLSIPILLRAERLYGRRMAKKVAPLAQPKPRIILKLKAKPQPQPTPNAETKPQPQPTPNPEPNPAPNPKRRFSAPDVHVLDIKDVQPKDKEGAEVGAAILNIDGEKGDTVGADREDPSASKSQEAANKTDTPVPVLRLPRYDILPEPGEGHHEDPPALDYDDVVPGCPAPMPVVVPESKLSAGLRYFKNYARVAVGMKKLQKYGQSGK